MDTIFENGMDDDTSLETIETYDRQVERPMARLKSSSRKPAALGMVRVVGEDDFAEASFLIPSDGMDMDEL